MTQVSDAKKSNMYLLVAFGHHRHRFGKLALAGEVVWCDNVYDAVVAVVQTMAREWEQAVCVLLDSLTVNELEIFSCLSGYDKVKTIAISSIAGQQKANQARLLGADLVLSLAEFARLFLDDVEAGFAPTNSAIGDMQQAEKWPMNYTLDDLLQEELEIIPANKMEPGELLPAEPEPLEELTEEYEYPEQSKIKITKDEMDSLLG